MNVLRRTPVYLGLLVVLAAGGAGAGWAFGDRTPPNAVNAGNLGCYYSGSDNPVLRLLPPSQHIAFDSSDIDSAPSGAKRLTAVTRCAISTRDASVTVQSHPLGGTTTARWEAQFASAHHLHPGDAEHVTANGGTLIWPSAAVSTFTCGHGKRAAPYGIEVRLGGTAGRATNNRTAVVGDVVSYVTQLELRSPICIG